MLEFERERRERSRGWGKFHDDESLKREKEVVMDGGKGGRKVSSPHFDPSPPGSLPSFLLPRNDHGLFYSYPLSSKISSSFDHQANRNPSSAIFALR